MKRIDTAQAPHELSKALEEFTKKKVSGITLGKPYEIEGGGMGRSIEARLDGELKSFVAIEQKGQVGIYDARLSPHAKEVHEILGRSNDSFGKNNSQTSAGQSKKASPADPAKAALAWPERKSQAAKITTAARTRRH
jgi:hypothetical protein